jgi:electron transport complex protein RnfG
MSRAITFPLRVLVIIFLSLGSFFLTCEAAAEDARTTQEIERAWLLKQALPGADRFETVERGGVKYEVAYRGQEIVGGVFYTEGVGYGGVMRFMVGLDPEGRVEGVVLVSHRETNRLGTKVTDPVFLSQFRGRSGPFILRRDDPSGNIDGIAGATRSTRGLIAAVEEAVRTFKEVWGKTE